MNNVVSMNGDQVPAAGEPNEALIRLLEQALAEARSGQLQSLVATGFGADGMRYALWCATHPNVYEMLGAIAWLHAEYVMRRES